MAPATRSSSRRVTRQNSNRTTRATTSTPVSNRRPRQTARRGSTIRGANRRGAVNVAEPRPLRRRVDTSESESDDDAGQERSRNLSNTSTNTPRRRAVPAAQRYRPDRDVFVMGPIRPRALNDPLAGTLGMQYRVGAPNAVFRGFDMHGHFRPGRVAIVTLDSDNDDDGEDIENTDNEDDVDDEEISSDEDDDVEIYAVEDAALEIDVPMPPLDENVIRSSEHGDCTICLEDTPYDPVGCLHCRQLIGCRRCVEHWYAIGTKKQERQMEYANHRACPLCRREWEGVPEVDSIFVLAPE